ncbi:hypothetical protein BN6_65520 [Saccharothrix espanaensis DSM 44229]|uniref:Uncharacterized protein n=1 Tax=Saccharothrix espanaensis (strain ATCC 51144 / DSM 44229 / JCM 9112 / NBRC 15066 / NRRL 15764) TaxID=1179773 RepID=K0K0L6_SACES|nr:hypothetical protein BN6_65520 [Saccharothrix espanaensis DSM 44229]
MSGGRVAAALSARPALGCDPLGYGPLGCGPLDADDLPHAREVVGRPSRLRAYIGSCFEAGVRLS